MCFGEQSFLILIESNIKFSLKLMDDAFEVVIYNLITKLKLF